MTSVTELAQTFLWRQTGQTEATSKGEVTPLSIVSFPRKLARGGKGHLPAT